MINNKENRHITQNQKYFRKAGNIYRRKRQFGENVHDKQFVLEQSVACPAKGALNNALNIPVIPTAKPKNIVKGIKGKMRKFTGKPTIEINPVL